MTLEQPVIRAKNVRVAILQKDEIPVSRARLAELERKERAHDAYLAATQHMRILMERSLLPSNVREGWKACLRSFSQAVVDAGREL